MILLLCMVLYDRGKHIQRVKRHNSDCLLGFFHRELCGMILRMEAKDIVPTVQTTLRLHPKGGSLQSKCIAGA